MADAVDDSPLDARGPAGDAALVAVVVLALVAVQVLGVDRVSQVLYGPFVPNGWIVNDPYVHVSGAHLALNVVGFTVTASTASLVCSRLGARRSFRLATVALLLALPLVDSIVRRLLLDTAVVHRGFSGIVSGFVGLVAVSLVTFLRRRYGPRTLAVVCSLVAVLLAVAFALTAAIGGPEPVVSTGLVAVGIAGGWGVVRRRSPPGSAPSPPAGEPDRSVPVRDDVLVGIGAFVFSASTLVLVRPSSFLWDVRSHGLPLLLGTAIVATLFAGRAIAGRSQTGSQ